VLIAALGDSVKHSILIVDRDRAFATILKEGLEATDEYEVTPVYAGRTALEAVASRIFDMVIVDLALEDVPASQLIESIRTARPSIRMMLIPLSDNRIPANLKDVEVQGLLPKPFFIGDLPAMVRHAMELDDAIPLTQLEVLSAEQLLAATEEAEALIPSEVVTSAGVTLPDLVPLGETLEITPSPRKPAPADGTPKVAPPRLEPAPATGAPKASPRRSEPDPLAEAPEATRTHPETIATIAPSAPAPRPEVPPVVESPKASPPSAEPRPAAASAKPTRPLADVAPRDEPPAARTVEPAPARELTRGEGAAGDYVQPGREADVVRVIRDLDRELHARAIVVTSGERLVASAGSIRLEQMAELARLVAIRVDSSSGMMRMVGEVDGFVEQGLEEGRQYRVYTLRLAEDLMLTVAASATIPLGTLRYRARKAAEEILALLH
jgi:DNA-binding NarL/FixJ family response regulator/predicted regulator of Ras-like GTPase activity (Roadblock/LC7/MglB family)